MIKQKDCKVTECFKTHRRELVGAVFLVLATLLTFLTLSGFGILGMFAVGLMLSCHRRMCCKSCDCGCCSSGCCPTKIEETMTTGNKATSAKKTTKS